MAVIADHRRTTVSGIPLTRDPDEMPGHEHCCFCGSATRMWYTPKDVAVCEPCALTHSAAEVPTKQVWCASAQARGAQFPRRACDSGSDRNGGDALAAPGEASQSGGAEGAASPTPLSRSNPHAN